VSAQGSVSVLELESEPALAQEQALVPGLVQEPGLGRAPACRSQ